MVDFRGLDEGLGHRQKRKREFEKLEEDLQAAKRIAVPMDEGAGKAEIEKVLSRTDPKTLGGMVSGRKWKVAATTRTSALGRSKPLQTSWDEKMRQKDVKKMFQQTVEHIKKSQEVMIASENKCHRQSTFQVGERVWVKASELGQEFGISRKLMPHYFCPWEVLDIVGNDLDGPSYVIRIPGHLHTYPVFHASKLAPFAEAAQFSSRRSMLPPTMDGHVDVDDILGHRDTPVPKPPGRGRPPKPAREYREKRRKKEEFMKRKEENTLKSAPVQKISNPKTIKKMMKSKNKRKQLQKVAE
ncbi:hypothetical protein CBR_g36252 [Chara braunii]|uniref:Coiled-coil domain-containing protein 86 n=1 Tax=Chara braunii TaxID=69332 RepID=A0A388LK73_CHABU|nr:hypothetical protein CBR_g36252 [Chara braunii]|eukprot:GBG82724.1 hypothetical protein CBR_g36252 [Chara braunii]